MPNYGNSKYWNKRYKKQKDVVFEWLENFEDLRTLIEKHCKKDYRILNLGCGNSIIQEDMYDDGYTNIVNMDISPVCIDAMEARKGKREGLIYQVMDCTDLKYEDDSFDFVIDKSTIDALLCSENSSVNVAKMLAEVQRVLKQGGVYLIISYGGPSNRILHFERNHLDFTCEHIVLPPKDATDGSGAKQSPHHAYILKKGSNAAEKYLSNYELVLLDLIDEEAQEALKYGNRSKDDESEEEEEDSEEDGDNKTEEASKQDEDKKE